MKQLHMWSTDVHEKKPHTVVWQLFIDGASKRNPGPAGSGFVLMKNDEVICQQGFYIGTKTNNQAEYYALVIGIVFAQKYMTKGEHLIIISDSQLLVRQMNGVYKVRDAGLRQLKELAEKLLHGHTHSIEHVLRQYNQLADAMANRGVEKKTLLPQEILYTLQHHDISI